MQNQMCRDRITTNDEIHASKIKREFSRMNPKGIKGKAIAKEEEVSSGKVSERKISKGRLTSTARYERVGRKKALN